MFSEILKEERLRDIIKIFDRVTLKGSRETDAEHKLESILNELSLQNNEFVDELVRDRTVLRKKKTESLRNRAQDGHIQLADFKKWLLDDLGKISIRLSDHFITKLLVIINYFEEYILKLKDRETSILSVRASIVGLIIASVAIVLSVVSIVLASNCELWLCFVAIDQLRIPHERIFR